ncbi:MAG: hypothetical protein HZB22_03925 [Deltaproteobacteria bacterium]|nr:hypothetical protein [Deltaproteobacteria bacterium]
MQTEHFRQAHDELLQAVGEISKLLTPADIQKDAAKVRSLLSRLAGKLLVHLQMEVSLRGAHATKQSPSH